MHYDKFTQIDGQRHNDIMYCKHLLGAKQNQIFQNKRHFIGLGPNHIKSLVNKEKIFKKALQRFLIDNVFYSVDEFLNYDVNNIWQF